ncbi:MAG: hypothetical protein QM713_10390 [Arachnia sp.]
MADDPFPGLVEVEIPDVDGRVHRFVEKCAVLDAGGRLSPDATYPVELHIACRPHHQDSRPGLEIDHACIDLTPWGVGDADQLVTVDRARLTWEKPAVYSDLSVAARQAVALVTFRQWRERVGLRHQILDALEEHLWAYATVTTDTFDAWLDADPLPRLPVKRRLPWSLTRAARSCGVDAVSLHGALIALTAITYDGLFGGIDSSTSLQRLQAVGEFTSRDGIPLADADRFVGSLWVDDDWGRPSIGMIDHWRHGS